jgi:pSer/pThr/pTyr-binding forkhead associated (FHA) protein
MLPNIKLILRYGPTPGKIFALDKPEMFIGRELNNEIVINDPEISRRHARLFVQGAQYLIEDLGSTNGTAVNGQRLMGAYALHPGEIITFGEHITLVVEMGQTPNERATVAAPRPAAPPPAAPAPVPPPPVYKQPVQPAQVYQAPPPPPAPVYQPPAPQQQIPVQPVYQAPAQPPAYINQLPQPPAEEVEVVIKKVIPLWVYFLIAILLVVILVLVVDDFRLWYLFGL